MPEDGWVCFHCGERFTTVNSARDHFGETPLSRAICTVTTEQFRRELREYRALEVLYHDRRPVPDALIRLAEQESPCSRRIG